MVKIVIYTRSGTISPSSNFRILQYKDFLKGDIECRPVTPEYIYAKHAEAKNVVKKVIWYSVYYITIQINIFRYMLKDIRKKPDCIIIQRALSPKILFGINKYLMKKAIKRIKRIIWDFDDDIFAVGEITDFEAQLLQKNADMIIVTSEILKRKLSAEAQKKSLLMPTTDGEFSEADVTKIIECREESYKTQIELLWLATGISLPNLYKISGILDITAKKIKEQLGKNLILHVVCNKPFEYDAKYLKIDNILWSKKTARKMLLQSHIGIMPLEDNEINRGKGGFKIIQYMSAAMPAVASAVGFNSEVIDDKITGFLVKNLTTVDEWQYALLRLSGNWKSYKDYCINSRNMWNKKFSFKANLEIWNKLISLD